MQDSQEQIYTVVEFIEILNQNLEYSYPEIVIAGEVSSFKINQNKWVFFDLKEMDSNLGCFMSIYQLKTPLEDGMLIKVRCTPKITKWGKFSLTIRSFEPVGEGSLKKSFELLYSKLEKEGLFLESKKRMLTKYPKKIGLITSKQAAAYNDFVTIINQRWSGLTIDHIQVQVQGETAGEQIISAIKQFNHKSEQYDAIVVIRGGGSQEDLQTFNTEPLVRAISASKIPTVVAIGHEDDVCLAELASDIRATTPTNAAHVITPDKIDEISKIDNAIKNIFHIVNTNIVEQYTVVSRFGSVFEIISSRAKDRLNSLNIRLMNNIDNVMKNNTNLLDGYQQSLKLLDPSVVLKRGYSIVRLGNSIINSASFLRPNDELDIEFANGSARAKIIDTIVERSAHDRDKQYKER